MKLCHTNSLDISMAIIRGDWKAEFAAQLPKTEAIENIAKDDEVKMDNIRPEIVSMTLM